MSELQDAPGARPVSHREVLHHGAIFDLVRDQVDFSPGTRFTREYLRHPGAVAILALDDEDRMLLIRQYRHPVGEQMWEIPAGLLDVAGEEPEQAARRELAEETDQDAAHWEPLVQVHPSGGASDELIRVFLARGLTARDGAPFERADEEAEIEVRWASVDQVARAVLAGDLTSGTLVTAVLALMARRVLG